MRKYRKNMKMSKLIAGMLVMLGFAACEPEEETKPGCDPEGLRYMYGPYPCAYESKSAVPDGDDVTEAAEFIISETEENDEVE